MSVSAIIMLYHVTSLLKRARKIFLKIKMKNKNKPAFS